MRYRLWIWSIKITEWLRPKDSDLTRVDKKPRWPLGTRCSVWTPTGRRVYRYVRKD